MNAAPRNDGGYAAQPVPSHIRLKLDANEGPPPSAAWFTTIIDQRGTDLARQYPANQDLERLLADELTCDQTQILITAGGDEALERICRLTLSEDAGLLVAIPTFEMLEQYAGIQRAPFIGEYWSDSDPYPVGRVLSRLKEGAGLLALVTPNNPTGRIIHRSEVERLIGAAQCPVLLDLAYSEFADDDLTDLALCRPGVVAVRTFSKAWGLAGLRVGYAVGDPAIIRQMRSCGSPYSVSAFSRSVASEAFVHGKPTLEQTVHRVRSARSTLSFGLNSLGFSVAPSEANFVLARHPHAERIWQRLREAGILVRRWTDRPGLSDALRITCPTSPDDLSLLIETIRAVAPEDTEQ